MNFDALTDFFFKPFVDFEGLRLHENRQEYT